jgi:exodeoxyribonuclease-3
MKVLSWNIEGAFPGTPQSKVKNQVEFLSEYETPPDIVMLQEASVYRRDDLRDKLREVGYSQIEDTLEWAAELRNSSIQPHHDIGHSNGNLTAIRTDATLELTRQGIYEGIAEDADTKHFSTNAPEKILVTTYKTQEKTIELWNVRAVPGSMHGEEKIKILEDVFNRITKSEQRLRILAGDFNTPDDEVPHGQAIANVWDKDADVQHRWLNAELNILKGLGHAGMVAVFRYRHGYGDLNVEDTSWGDNRFDHIFASEALEPVNCYYDHAGLEYSDHAPVIAEFGNQ